MTAIVVLLVGLLLLFLEFFLPGGIMGTAGALLVISSVGFFVAGDHTVVEVLLFIIVAAAGVLGVVKSAMALLRNSSSESGLFSNADQEGYKASSFDQSLVGQQGVAASDLKPSGHIVVNNKKHQALSESGYITAGGAVEVVGGRGAYLIVRAKKA